MDIRPDYFIVRRPQITMIIIFDLLSVGMTISINPAVLGHYDIRVAAAIQLRCK